MAEITTEQVWMAVDKQMFCVVGMVNARGQGRTAGVVYTVHDRALWFASQPEEWKVRHITATPDVSVTVPVQRGGPLLAMLPIPPATITFVATATVHPAHDAPAQVVKKLLRGLEQPEARGEMALVELRPSGDFVTYGIGTSLMGMRDTEAARGRAPATG